MQWQNRWGDVSAVLASDCQRNGLLNVPGIKGHFEGLFLPLFLLLVFAIFLAGEWVFQGGHADFRALVFCLVGIASLIAGLGKMMQLRVARFFQIEQVHTATQQQAPSIEARYRAIFATSPDAILVVDGAAMLVEWNPAAEKMFGLSPVTAASETHRVSEAIIPPLLGKSTLAEAATVVLGVSDRLCGERTELEALRIDGTTFTAEVTLSRIPADHLPAMVITVRDIHVEKQIHDALSERERRFGILAESIPQKIWTAQSDGTFDYFNRNWSRYTGLTPQALKSDGWFQVLHPDEAEASRDAWNVSLAGGALYQMEHRFRRADGVYRWHLTRVVPIRDADDGILVWVGSSTDVDDLKHTEQALLESERRFRTMADDAPVMIWMTGSDRKRNYVNRRWLTFTGRSLDAELADGWEKHIHSDDVALYQTIYAQAWATTQPFEIEYRLLAVNGEYRWILDRGVPLWATDQSSVTGYIGSSLDITERKQMSAELEKQVAERTQDLQNSTALLHSIIENVPGMIFLKDAETLRFKLFNRAGEALLGYSRDDLIGKNDYDFFPVDQADYFIQKDRETLNNRMQVNITEEKIQTSSGETRILHTRKVPIVNDEGLPQYLLGISEDITEFKKSQDQVDKLNRQLEKQVLNLNAVNKELESFSYSVSHDLRAPLRTIDGFSQAILEDYDAVLDERGKNYLNRVRSGSQQMAQLIDDMLNLSRVSRGALRIEPDVDLSRMARDILAELSAQEPDRAVETEIEPGLTVPGDRHLLQAVMQNLLQNAWKFTQHCPVTCIRVMHQERDGKIMYTVQDNGAGFEMQYADKMFGAFQRLHTDKEFPGTGIGLATVQRIIHRHGGKIWAEGAVNAGATLYFTLNPLAFEQEDNDAVE